MAGAWLVPGGEEHKRYPAKMTFVVFCIILLAGSGGLLLGYDNGIIGGVAAMPDFQYKFFPVVYRNNVVLKEGSDSAYCKYNDARLQLIVSSLYLSGACTGLFAAHWARKYGRKLMLFIAGVFFVVGAGITGGAVDVAMLVIGRLVIGVGLGLGCMIVPMHTAEIAPPHWRGAVNNLFQLFVTIGIFVAGLINYGMNDVHPWGWRLSLALAAVPGFIVCFGGMVLPDSPVSLMERAKVEQARQVLERVRGLSDVDEEFEVIAEAARQSVQVRTPWKNLFKSEYRPQLIISLLFMLFQQFTGVNAIVFFAPVLFSSLGSSSHAALENTTIIGAVFVAATLIGIALVDRLGRKVLLVEGGIQMIITEIIVGVTLAKEFAANGVNLPANVSSGVLAVICLFIAGFAWSWGTIGWLYPIEVQPLETRAAGSSLNVASNMIFTFIIVFIFFAAIVLIMTAFCGLLPETKGKDIDNVFRLFQEHWFWPRVCKVKNLHSSNMARAHHGSVPDVDAALKPYAADEEYNVGKAEAAQRVATI